PTLHALHQRCGARCGGAYLGRKLSNGDPLATAAGAAGGGGMSETLHYAARNQADKAYATGYDKCKSDSVKQQYWFYVSMQRQRNEVGNVTEDVYQEEIGDCSRHGRTWHSAG